MLTSTFCHVPGIGLRTEAKLWEEGARSWDDCIEIAAMSFSKKRAQTIESHLYASQEALEEADIHFFTSTMPAGEQWRIFPEFRNRIAYLDIETTGLGTIYGDHITTIALYDGSDVRHYVHGENLRDFKDDISNYDLLVTYNGKCFDIPFIENYFMTRLPQAHIDLRYVLGSLGIKGGLKGCEAQLGLDRGDLEGVDGYFAVLLWNDYNRNGNPRALETLLAYNIQDTVNLEQLMIAAYNMKIAETPFADSHLIELPSMPPENPFLADVVTIERIREQMAVQSPGWW
jgi:uncharacterized protein YprB with RNaseH-like and TPR domain